jgi:hypothetical protein
MAGRFLHVSIIPSEDATSAQIEEKLNKALDWMRYRPGIYVVFTKLSAKEWSRRLGVLAKPKGELFVAELDLSGLHGYMKKNFWEWVRKNKERQPEA